MQRLAPRLLPCLVAMTTCAATAAAQAQTLFDAPVMFDLPDEFELVADVDHDGDVDILAFQPFGNTSLKTQCRVYWNDGLANFTPGPVLALPADSGTHVRYADVDGDTWGDLLVTTNNNMGAPALRIYPGLPGGQFAAPIVRPLLGNVSSLTTGDANNDGIQDIGLLNFNGFAMELGWLAGDPARVFPPGPLVALSFDYRPVLVALDADGDGDSDLATLRYGATGSLDLYFSSGFSLTTGPSLPTTVDASFDLAALDLDSDGDLDLCAHVGTGTLSFVPFTNLGGGTWAAAPAQPMGNYYPGRLDGSDFDGDGDLDLVLRTYTMQGGGFTFSHTLVWFTNHNGTFTATRYESVPGTGVGVGAGLTDIDGDGDRDLVNAEGLRFTHPLVLSDSLASNLGGGLRDWDDDGDLDGRIESTLTLRRNDGSGAFTLQPGFWPPNPAPNTFYRSPIVVADFDGDGLQEALVARIYSLFPSASTFVGMYRLEANAQDQLVDVGFACSSELTGGVALDADGDGDLDVVTPQGVAVQGPAGQFTLLPQAFGGHTPIATGDVDGDSDLDVLAASPTMGLAVLVRTSPATFTLQIVAPSPSIYIVPAMALLADADNDGDLDIVAARQATPSGSGSTNVQIYTNHNGVFTLALTIAETGLPLVGDVDGNGRTDLVVLAPNTAFVLLRQGSSGLNFAPGIRFAHFAGSTLGDLDQDGDLDLVGHRSYANLRHSGAAAGSRLQYGTGSPGTGGRVPLLSMAGQIRTGLVPSVRVRRGHGGAPVALVFGATQTYIPNLLPGVTGYVDNLFSLLLFTMNGAPGQPGAGGLDMPMPIPPGVAGYEVFVHALVLDPVGPIGLVPSNATRFTVGN